MSGICWTAVRMLLVLVSAVSETLPPPVEVKSEKFPLILDKLVLRLPSCAERVFRPVKKADPLEVTLPLSRSSTKMAAEQPRLLIAGPKVLTLVKPMNIIKIYHKLRHR